MHVLCDELNSNAYCANATLHIHSSFMTMAFTVSLPSSCPTKTFISFFVTSVKRWDLSAAESENIWHANGNRKDNMNVLMLYNFQTFTLGLEKTVVPNH